MNCLDGGNGLSASLSRLILPMVQALKVMSPCVSPFPRLRQASLRIAAFAAIVTAQLAIAQAQTATAPLAVSTLAGTAGTRRATDATGSAARFYAPSGLVFDTAGNLIVADSCNNIFRKVTPAGVVTTFSGVPIDLEDRPINVGSTDGPPSAARFHIGDSSADGPWAPPVYTIIGSYTLGIDSAGTVYVADTLNNTIRKIASNGTVSTFAGQASQEGTSDGNGSGARFASPSGVAVDGAGNVYVTDTANNTVRKITSSGTVTTLAGVARTNGSTDGTGTAARFSNPSGVAVDSSGNLYVTDSGNHTIRRITPAGVVTTFAGLAGSTGSSDGSGTLARFNAPSGIAIDSAGNLYVADTGNHAIRKITSARAVTTIAGRAGVSGSTDATGDTARFLEPTGITVDAAGNVYVADTSNNTIRRGVPVTGSGAGALTVQSQPQRQLVIVNTSATFKVVATGTPAPTYQWQKNEANINGATSATYTIPSSQFADAGLYSVVVTSGNLSFTSTPAQLQVFPSGTTLPPIIILAQPTDQDVTVGQPVTFSVETAGTTSPTYQWRKNDSAISGANLSTFTIGAAQLGDAGVYTLTIVDGSNTVSTIGSTLTVRTVASTTAPSIVTPPTAQTANIGGSASFTVVAGGTPAPTYQWTRNGTPLGNGPTATGASVAGATTATLTLTGISTADAGNYAVTVTNSAGVASSSAAVLAVNDVPTAPSRIINLSILTTIGSAGDNFTMGYVVGGAGTSGAKPLVIRAVGPSLGALGVPGTLADPKLELFAGSTRTTENDNWGGSAAVAGAMAGVGAFPFTSGTSLDAAVLGSITTRDNSVKVSAANTGTGTVIAEVYDATPAGSFTGLTPRLLNVSVLKNIGSTLTAGFVIAGPTSKTVLIRAIGPTLNTAFGITGVVANPQMILFGAGQARLGENDNWGGTAALNAAFTAVGAFALPAASQDAALLVTLNPGDYSVVVTGVGGTSGIGLVEVYDVP